MNKTLTFIIIIVFSIVMANTIVMIIHSTSIEKGATGYQIKEIKTMNEKTNNNLNQEETITQHNNEKNNETNKTRTNHKKLFNQ